MNDQQEEQRQHKEKMQAQKKKVDSAIKAAQIERGVSILLTGNGKGKTSSAFGMVFRALGYKQKVGIVQFIKGAQESGEINFIKDHLPDVELFQMGTGFTWNTQDKAADIRASEATWQVAEKMLNDATLNLVVLDELTYMLGYQYLDRDMVINAIKNRPTEQSLIVTGRGGGRELREAMDTVSDVKNIKHAYKSGIKARKGVDC
ncbi:cob(I)yrinic acid a,c-diamide adenosyltransferase [Arenicella xantha]|uniref:Corrinoid adenosyltransferase n=1 Tax=Arenicella xantha TaxID=644221 RepID=A0A395JFY9_9GAMM|nr:cob(I)yrinic acid a,c-diamide adenosyltransferase [Arenicella xantha]RBP48588.1 cob(I)alamin adenosyltransferase [Arenicella xantha]